MARTAKVVIGDRDCSAACISALKAAGIPTGGATYTGDIKNCFLSTGVWQAKPVSFIASPGDLYLKEGSHVAMCKQQSPDELLEFSHNEVYGYYNGKVGDQLNAKGKEAESHIRPYYNYPWNVIMHYTGDRQKAADAVKIMEFMCTDPRFGYTMSSPGRWGTESLGYATIKLDDVKEPDKPSTSTEYPVSVAIYDGSTVSNLTVKEVGKHISLSVPKTLKYLSISTTKGTIKAKAYTKASKWLPSLSNPGTITNHKTGAIGDGGSILGVQFILESPKSDYAVFYRVKANGTWFDWMQDDREMSNGKIKAKGDNFAGDLVHGITAIEVYIDKATY